MTTRPGAVPWPHGARCAACISWDVDADTLILQARPGDGHERYGPLSWLRYDEVGVPAIVDRLAEYGLTQTFFVTGWCIERYPAMCEAILAGGHEIAHHGVLHAAPNELSPEGELEELRRGIEIIERFTGRRPAGWRAPFASMSPRSAGYLIEERFEYDSSLMDASLPYLLQADGGTLIEVPIDVAMSDWPHYAHVADLGVLLSPKAPEDAVRAFRAEFDAAYERGGLFLTIWHPHVSGRPARLDAWTKLVEYMLAKGDVWFAPLEKIAGHVRARIGDGTYRPRQVRMPYYEAPPDFATGDGGRRAARDYSERSG